MNDMNRQEDATSIMMYPGRQQALETLLRAHQTGEKIVQFPQQAEPQTLEQAHAVQDELVMQLGGSIAGWKVSVDHMTGQVTRGVILSSLLFSSPATLRVDPARWVGIEAEIAFRFEQDFLSRPDPYDRQEVMSAVTAFVAIEIVGSRFADYHGAPRMAKIADFMSNDGLVRGTLRPDWRDIDLAGLDVQVNIDGETRSQTRGIHSSGNPFNPVVPFVNAMRHQGIKKGQFVTTGTCSDLVAIESGGLVEVIFSGFGQATIHIQDILEEKR